MGARHSFPEHTADLACEVRAPSFEELVAESARAFTDAVTELDRVEPRQTRSLSVAAASREELLVAWLEELVYLFETTDLLPRRADVQVEEAPSGGFRLDASVAGEPFAGDRHPLKTLIKGVTYHDLSVAHGAAGWRAYWIFDI